MNKSNRKRETGGEKERESARVQEIPILSETPTQTQFPPRIPETPTLDPCALCHAVPDGPAAAASIHAHTHKQHKHTHTHTQEQQQHTHTHTHTHTHRGHWTLCWSICAISNAATTYLRGSRASSIPFVKSLLGPTVNPESKSRT